MLIPRNTVSKVINGRGAVQEPTRQMVLKKAMELGYFQMASGDALQPEIPLDRRLCILGDDASPYSDPDWLAEKILEMPQLPDALICVNDYIAIHVMTALKQIGLAIPEQIMVAGFDGTAQSAVVEPTLTTVQIPGAEIGRMAADVLLNRIANPGRSPVSVYVNTTPILRESTNRK